MTQAKARKASLDDRITAEVARQVEPLREILERLQARAEQSAAAPGETDDASLATPWPPGHDAAPDQIRQITKSSKDRLKLKEDAVRARIAEIERHIAARLAQPKPQGDSHE